MKALSLAVAMTAIYATSSLAQYTPECNQMRELYRQYNQEAKRHPRNTEENNILEACAPLAAFAGLNSGQTYGEDLSGCFYAGCMIGNTTSNCTRKATIIKDSLNLTDRMERFLCPKPELSSN